MNLFDNLKLTKTPMVLPLVSGKDPDTLPYKDWLRACGINDILTEDDIARETERRIRKVAERYGRKTPDKELHKAFPTLHLLRQLDVKEDDGRSSDISLVRLGYKNRLLYSHAGTVVISEHAVRRYWQHTNQRPNIEDWLARFPNWYDEDTNPTELYSPDGLLLGESYIAANILQGIYIDTKMPVSSMGIGFRIKTVVPVGLLNENQRTRWYKLKQEWEDNA